MSAEEIMPVGTRIKLKADCIEFYQIGTSKFDDEPVYVSADSEAHVMSHRDDEGFDLILVRWERDDWRYANQPDGWAYPSHFEVVHRPKIEESDEPMLIASERTVIDDHIARAMQQADDRCPHCGSPHSEDTQGEIDRQRYLDLLAKATNAAGRAEGFLTLAIVEEEDEGRTFLVPHFYSASMSDETVILLEAQLADLVATNYKAHALKRLKELHDES